MDRTLKQMREFIENVEFLEENRELYQGKFVAVFEQNVLAWDDSYKNIWSRIRSVHNEPQLYVSYVPREDEVVIL